MLILLDIDGVMVLGHSWRILNILEDGFPDFDKQACINLQKIISETAATIVLTTSHKSKFSFFEWENIFKRRGIVINNIQKLNNNIEGKSRCEEILEWLEYRSENKPFVIIDDDKQLGNLSYNIKKKCVITSALIGLNEDNANSAIHILKSQVLTNKT